MIDEIELPRVSAELAELHAVFDSAVADLEEWQRDEAPLLRRRVSRSNRRFL
jgi:hypothetical protein